MDTLGGTAQDRKQKGYEMPRIYQTEDYGMAQYRITVVDDPGLADLWVYVTTSFGLASGDSYWYITRDRNEADLIACFTSYGAAQLRVHFVADRGQAGWQRPHPLQGKLSRTGF